MTRSEIRFSAGPAVELICGRGWSSRIRRSRNARLARGARIAWLAIALASSGAAALAEEYKIDPVCSYVSFRIKHNGYAMAYGRFDDLGGTFMLDEKTGDALTFDIGLKSESVNTNNAKRDAHLKNADFFSVKEFPTIEFKSKLIRRNGESGYEVAGDMTLHGVTRPINVHLERIGSGKDHQGAWRTGFEGSFVIKRSDYGMNWGLDGSLGDEVTIYVAFEGVRK